MHYFFMDESYALLPSSQHRIAMAVWAVEQQKWSDGTAAKFDLFRNPILRQICSMLESLNGSAIVSTAILDGSLFRAGETDATNDIPLGMARRDNVWSTSACFTAAAALFDLLRRGQEVGTVDIHFDSKSLKPAHLDAIQRTLRESVVAYAKKFPPRRDFDHRKKVSIRRVEPVLKSGHANLSNKFEAGTWIADKLCSNLDEIESLKCPHITLRDMSEEVRRTTQQFDGESFYAS
jgi:hypothetical protein